MWRRLTFEQIARTVKLIAGVSWGTMELWLWGARPYALAFIGAVLGISEAVQLLVRLRGQEP